jgi:glycosyltransferase involved in cell wall biosynthesis
MVLALQQACGRGAANKAGAPQDLGRTRRNLYGNESEPQTTRLDIQEMPVTLIVPTLNEIEGMKIIMPRISPDWFEQIIVIDGGSTDGTLEYATARGYLVILQKTRGMRHAYTELLPLVTGDVIITFSPDGNSIPELIPNLIEEMKKGNDMVIVSRYLGNAKSLDDNWFTGLANRIFTQTINLLFRARYTDAMVIYRAYRKKLIRTLDLDGDSGYYLPEKVAGIPISWEMLMSIRCAKRKLRVAEIPGSEPPRIGGGKKIHYRWGFGYVMQVFVEVFSRDTRFNGSQSKK